MHVTVIRPSFLDCILILIQSHIKLLYIICGMQELLAEYEGAQHDED